MSASETLPQPATGPSHGLRARFRQRMHDLAGRRSALFFLSLLSFLDACCSPILPEVLLVPMCLGQPRRSYYYAFWCSAASVVGGIVGYALGLLLWEHGLREFAFAHVPGFTPEWFAKVSDWYGREAFLWVWLAGFTPLPYKIFTVSAGVCHDKVDFWVFLAASITSRFPRLYLEVWLLNRFGQPVLDFLLGQFSRVVLVLLLIVLGVVLWLQWG
ncbi:MAG: DedA family protein [Planctomycetes bacterium]|nr:DedA family protein [Planctomycetota bacterium]